MYTIHFTCGIIERSSRYSLIFILTGAIMTPTQTERPSNTPDMILEGLDVHQLNPEALEKALQILNDKSPAPTQVAAPSKETPDNKQDERVKKVCCTIL
jgi:hypothetical protein